jgi:hypothetical protein
MLMSQFKDKQNSEYENDSHIGRKKKAIAQQFQKKNQREIVELMNEEDDSVAEKYARYVK